MKTKYIIILVIAVCCFIAGCVEESNADSGRFTEVYREDIDKYTSIIILHDNLNNCTVYITDGYNSGGVSVIPDWQLKAPVER